MSSEGSFKVSAGLCTRYIVNLFLSVIKCTLTSKLKFVDSKFLDVKLEILDSKLEVVDSKLDFFSFETRDCRLETQFFWLEIVDSKLELLHTKPDTLCIATLHLDWQTWYKLPNISALVLWNSMIWPEASNTLGSGYSSLTSTAPVPPLVH
jgi:hypothetical protein